LNDFNGPGWLLSAASKALCLHCDDGVRKYCTPEKLLLLQLVAVQSCVPQMQQQPPQPFHICPSLDPIGALLRSVDKAQLQQQPPHPFHICPSFDPIGALLRSVDKAG
jgi:hypothetical protein